MGIQIRVQRGMDISAYGRMPEIFCFSERLKGNYLNTRESLSLHDMRLLPCNIVNDHKGRNNFCSFTLCW